MNSPADNDRKQYISLGIFSADGKLAFAMTVLYFFIFLHFPHTQNKVRIPCMESHAPIPHAQIIHAGEYLVFASPVVTEGRPEEWLNRVEDAMFATTKKHLYKALEDSKGGWAAKMNQSHMPAGQSLWAGVSCCGVQG